jgi:hypothetical protein
LPEQNVSQAGQNIDVVRNAPQNKPVFSFALRPTAFPSQQSASPTVGLQIIGRFCQALLDNRKGGVQMLTLDFDEHALLPVLNRLPGGRNCRQEKQNREAYRGETLPRQVTRFLLDGTQCRTLTTSIDDLISDHGLAELGLSTRVSSIS